ncbi:ceramidase domain-containing protein [Ilumatobacter sp.]|uniref:ceramidase domain-containing protein n=1 Tax=Ilumatobacter sp. TaxID=1967498 RepID=UPI003AF40F86
MFVIADGIGASDCEAIGDALLAQPVNALSSLAYVVVGIVVVGIATRGRRAIGPSVVYGSCVAAIGVGSVLFHGPQTAGSQVLHDLPILITALFVVVADALLLRPGMRRPWSVFVAAAIAATALTIVEAALAAAASGVAVAAIVVLEVVIYRRRLRDIPPRRQLMVYGLMLTVVAVAATAWLLGRTGSPACDPEGTWQFHALWHVISAGLFATWWWLALWESQASRPPDTDSAA